MRTADKTELRLVEPSQYQTFRAQAYRAFKMAYPRSQVTEDEFFEIYGLGYDTSARISYDNGWNAAMMTKV
jgi:hypothetical protein